MTIKSAIVDSEIFLQGEFLSIGINRDGSLGTRKAAPTGFNSDTDSGYYRVGMYADLDGFGKGEKSQLKDAILPGRAIEGYNIGYKIDGKTIVHSNQSLTGYSEIAGTNRNNSTASAGEAGWQGTTSEKLGVSQTITLADDAKFIRIDVTLTNNSSGAMSDVRYMRTADADQGSSFATNNKIVRQGDDGALVASYAGKSATPFFLFSEDARAVVSTFGFVNTDPYAPAAYDNEQAAGYTKSADETVNITFGLGTLRAGESTTITLYMGVTDDLGRTIAAIEGGPSTPTPPVVTDLAPVVANDKLTVEEEETGRGNVLSNDRDPEGKKLTAELKTGPANGTVKLAADGSYTYTAKDDFSGTDSFTYTASDGKNAAVGTVTITVTGDDDDDDDDGAPPVVDLAPVVGDDRLTVGEGESGRGNVLSNDRDPEGGKLTAALKSGPANGKVTLAADGGYSYTAKDGFSGTDSFTYAASDGKNATVGKVTVTVEADPEPPVVEPTRPGDTLLTRAGTQDGSAAANQTLTGPAYQNSFYFDVAANSGDDVIANFGNNDVLVVNKALFDGNGDGVINLSKGRLNIDAPKGDDTVRIVGTSALRLLGTDENGMVVYADASVRPKGAIESKLGDDRMLGDGSDKKKDVFFFDTALDIDLGNDRIDAFGARDVIVTTSALVDGDGDGRIALTGGVLKLTGGMGGPSDTVVAGEAGSVDLHTLGGAAVDGLEFDGTVVRDGTTYYVYSLEGSAAGLSSLDF